MLTHSPEETRAFGRRLAEQLLPGDVLLFYGNLGAGKSEMTRGIAEGLGVSGPVTSPSFTILNVYDDGRVRVRDSDDNRYVIDDYRKLDAHSRKQMIPATTEVGMGYMPTMPVEVNVGGATVFVVDVERFERL